MEERDDIEYIKSKVTTVPDYPKKGIMFRDITTLLSDPEAFGKTIDILQDRYDGKNIDTVAGIESRGYIFGAALAYQLGVGFIPLRKPGKLPREVISQEYDLEYGTDKLEIHKDAIGPGERILLLDDLLATGGTAQAAGNLVRKVGGEIIEYTFVIELPTLNGRAKLEGPVYSMIKFEGE
jgi:adenine phosphoribosyltransferase